MGARGLEREPPGRRGRRPLVSSALVHQRRPPPAGAEPASDNPAIRIVIAEDHALVRAGLRRVLEAEEDLVVDDEAGNGDEAVRLARLHKPDLVLLDLVMPDSSGLEVLPEISQAAPQARTLILSMHDDPSYVRAAFAAGACGYLLKEAADTELVAAVREVATGRRYVYPCLGARLADEADAGEQTEDVLSTREREVLRLLALGYRNQEVARMLYISVRTAETHRAHIMQKLGLSTRADLVGYALHKGLLANGDASDVLQRPALQQSNGAPAERDIVGFHKTHARHERESGRLAGAANAEGCARIGAARLVGQAAPVAPRRPLHPRRPTVSL